jgi:nucleotide-binding universal stress UspA family protein
MNDDELQEFDQQVARVAAALNQRPARGAYTQILLAYDGSADARAALERVAAVVSDDCDVTVVTVIPYEAVGSKLDPIEPTDRDWQRQRLVEATAYLREHGIEPFIEAAAGNPAPVICDTARSLEADLVILGYGHGGRWRPSVRTNPVRPAVEKSLKCDTLVVRAEQRAAATRLADAPDERHAGRLARTVASLGTGPTGVSHLVSGN